MCRVELADSNWAFWEARYPQCEHLSGIHLDRGVWSPLPSPVWTVGVNQARQEDSRSKTSAIFAYTEASRYHRAKTSEPCLDTTSASGLAGAEKLTGNARTALKRAGHCSGKGAGEGEKIGASATEQRQDEIASLTCYMVCGYEYKL